IVTSFSYTCAGSRDGDDPVGGVAQGVGSVLQCSIDDRLQKACGFDTLVVFEAKQQLRHFRGVEGRRKDRQGQARVNVEWLCVSKVLRLIIIGLMVVDP